MSADVTVLKHLMILNLDVSIWTARKKLSPKDFGSATLPPEGLATLGSKRVCNPDDLRIFGTLKSRAVSMLDRVGIRFLGGWGIPVNNAKDIVEELEKIQGEFVAARIDFLSRYDQSIADWLNQNEEWKDIIKGSVVSGDYVSSRISFDWQMYQLASPKKSGVYDSLRGEVSKLGAKLLNDIAKTADDTWNKCYLGKIKVSQKALSPLKSIYYKLENLGFVEPCALPMAEVLKATLDNLPRKGFITNSNLTVLQGMLAILRDPVEMIRHGHKVIDGATPESILDSLVCNKGMGTTETEESVSEPVNIATLNQQAIESLGLW